MSLIGSIAKLARDFRAIVFTDGTNVLGTAANPIIVSQSSGTIAASSTLTTPIIAGGLTASGSGSNDFSGSTGGFKTSTGANQLSGNTTLAANKSFTGAAGSGSVDLSGMTGTFKTPTGTFTEEGPTAASASARSIADPGNAGAISVATDGVCNLVSAGSETRTLAAPGFIGQQITIACDTHGGDIAVTVNGGNFDATHHIATLTAVVQSITLVGVTVASALRWSLLANNGTTLS